MDVEALADCRPPLSGDLAVVHVFQAIDARRDADDQISFVVENPAGDIPRGIVVETFDEDLRLVRDPVAIGVLDAVHPLLEFRQIAPVARAILVVVLDPRVLAAALGAHLASIEVEQILTRLERVRRREPGWMLPDVERHVVARRTGHVDCAALVQVDGHRIDDQLLRGPEGQLQARRHVDGDFRAFFLGRARGVSRCEPHDFRVRWCRWRLIAARLGHEQHQERREREQFATARAITATPAFCAGHGADASTTRTDRDRARIVVVVE